jgi:hypothetical protein
MRPTTWVILISFCLLTAAIRAQPVANRRSPAPAVQARAGTEYVFDFQTDPAYGASEEDARQIALERAVAKVDAYLGQQKPPVLWRPDADYVRKHLKIDENVSEAVPEGVPAAVKKMVQLHVGATPETYRDILRNDQHLRAEQRQWFLIRVLGVLVAGLTAAAGALRMVARAKPTTAGWVKVASVGVVAALALGMLVLG